MGMKKGSHWGAKVSREVFYECVNAICLREMRQIDAAKRCGMSDPTFRKWANKAVLGEELPDNLFSDEE